MQILLVILGITLALAWRARIVQRCLNPVESEMHDDSGMVDACARASLLVLGSSLTVMSGYRFVLHAAKLGIPVAVVNQGPTRGDAQATVRVDAPLGEVVPRLVDDLLRSTG